MLRFALLLAFMPCLAHADLYRWVEPESGSVKLSSQPPTDARVNAEVVPFRAPAATAKPPAAPGAKAAAATASAQPAAVQALQARWRELVDQIANARPEEIARNPGQAQAYEAVRRELDRLDPNGAAERQAVAARGLERLREGLVAQGGTQPRPAPVGR